MTRKDRDTRVPAARHATPAAGRHRITPVAIDSPPLPGDMRQRPLTRPTAPAATTVMPIVDDATAVTGRIRSANVSPADVHLPAHTALEIALAPLAARLDGGDTRTLPVVGMYERAYESDPAPDAAEPAAQSLWTPAAADDADATMNFTDGGEAPHPTGNPSEDELELYRVHRRLMDTLPPGREADAVAAADDLARRNDAWFTEAEQREERAFNRLMYLKTWWDGITAASTVAELNRRVAAESERGIPVSLDTLVAGIRPDGEAERYRRELDELLNAGTRSEVAA